MADLVAARAEGGVRTVAEAAARLRCSRSRVYELIRAGDLRQPPSRLGHEALVTVASVVALEQRLGFAPAQPKAPPKARRPRASGDLHDRLAAVRAKWSRA
jgi:excisionase family DNA binding protein